jgi:hypothetical protein
VSAASAERGSLLGSIEGWGLLGVPLDDGPLAYLSAENLVSPTWAPPELDRIGHAWPGEDAIWVQFDDSRIALYDYPTGHLLSFDSLNADIDRAVALQGRSALVARGESSVQLVAAASSWRLSLGGRVDRLVKAGGSRVVAVVEGEPQSEVVVIEPPAAEPLARRQVAGVQDLVVMPWGDELYYLSRDDADTVIHGLSLPELGNLEDIPLPKHGRAIAVTPSAHRMYVAAGQDLHVIDRLGVRPIRQISLPGSASALRFGLNGAVLMARLEGADQVALIRVGVDSLLGVIPAEWDEHLPVGLPGGRLVARLGQELVLYDVPRLVEAARAETRQGQVWLAVKWQPPRPRTELARRTASPPAQTAAPRPADSADEAAGSESGVRSGHYAVVVAARQRDNVDQLVAWLKSVGYPGVVDRHRDVMGVVWFRAMVGPYGSREQAEGAAQSLGARYGYKPWIHHVERSEELEEDTEASDTVPADTAAADRLDGASGASRDVGEVRDGGGLRGDGAD